MSTPFLAVGGAYDKEFQRLLLVHLAHCDNLLKLAAPMVKPADFEIPVQRLVYEALLDYYTTFRSRPNTQMLELQILKVIQNSDRRYTSSITPEENEAMVELLIALRNPGALSEDRFIAELGPYLHWIRGTRLVAQYQAQGGNMAELTTKLVDIGKQVTALDGEKVQHRISEKHGLILSEAEAPICISTGLTRFDAYLDGGIRRNELGMFTACPGVGKTNTLIHMALMASLSLYRVLYITLELEHDKISRRYIAMGSGVPARYTKLPISVWTSEHKRRVGMFLDPAFGAYDRLTICDLSGKTCPVSRMEREIETWMAATDKEFGSAEDCALVCVDWADKWTMPGLGKETPEHLRLTKVIGEMDNISHRLPVGVWTATQGNKQADNHSVLMMSDAAGAYHKNDSLDIGVGIGIHNDDRVKVEQALNGLAYGGTKEAIPASLRLIFTINKNREGSSAAFNLFRAETLRLYDSPDDYKTFDHNISNATNAAMAWNVSKLQTAVAK